MPRPPSKPAPKRLRSFRVRYSPASSTDDENLFAISGPGTEYIARCHELAGFIETVLNVAMASFPAAPVEEEGQDAG